MPAGKDAPAAFCSAVIQALGRQITAGTVPDVFPHTEDARFGDLDGQARESLRGTCAQEKSKVRGRRGRAATADMATCFILSTNARGCTTSIAPLFRAYKEGAPLLLQHPSRFTQIHPTCIP